MFNLVSFLIGVGSVFVIAFIIFSIGDLTNWYDAEDGIMYFMLSWLVAIKWLWEHRLIQRITQKQYKNIINIASEKYPERTFDPKHIFGNVYSVTWYADKVKHPILGRLRMIIIVKK